MRKSWLAATLLAALSSPVLAAEAVGDWMVADKVAVVRVAPCAPDAPALCGNIVWTKGPPRADKNNPDPAKRTRSVMGMETLIDMKPTSANRWEGEIYNAEDGKNYSGRILLLSDNVLRIEGCVLGILCGGQNWTRAKCEEPPPPAPARRGATAPPPAPAPTFPTSCREVAP
jgi:uncharacterized protein (DUF2147 family)